MRLIAPSSIPCATPTAAFDALHAHCASPLVRQVELLTGNPRLARLAVRHAFDLAWRHWPAVAVDRDPVGWLRAAAYDHALAPWQRWIPRHRPRRRAAAGPEAALRTALLRLSPASRRTAVLYDGLGLDLPETAAETAASTAATAGRILRARAALGEGAAARLAVLLDEPRPAGPAAPVVRRRSERRVRGQTFAALALTGAVAVATVTGIVMEQTHPRDEPPATTAPAPDTPDLRAPLR